MGEWLPEPIITDVEDDPAGRAQTADSLSLAMLVVLEALPAHDVQLTTDGGGKVPALERTLYGRNRVARTLVNCLQLGTRLPGVSLRAVELNGGPGALVLDAQRRLINVVALDIAGDQIMSINSIANPDELTHLGPVGDLTSLLSSAR